MADESPTVPIDGTATIITADGPAFAPPTTKAEQVANKAEPKAVVEIEAEVDANIFATWTGNSIGLAALSMTAFLIWPRRKRRQLPIAYGFAVLSVLVLIWSTATYFGRGRKHWSIWIIGLIVVFIIATVIGLLVIL